MPSKDPIKRAEAQARYKQTQKGRSTEQRYKHNRRARIRDAYSDPIDRETLRHLYGDQCHLCGGEMEFVYRDGSGGPMNPLQATHEHLLPISRGGNNSWYNSRLAHLSCNMEKSDMTYDEWLQKKGHPVGRMVIGLCGKKRSGKNTMADLFCQERKFTQVAFADALWNAMLAMDPWVFDDFEGGGFVRLSEINKQYGYEFCKANYPDVRTYMQKLGTQGIREFVGQTTWLDVVQRQIQNSPHTNFIVTDLRFDNEAQMVQDVGGLVIKLERDSDDGDLHISEQRIDAIHHDVLYYNTGTLSDMHAFVKITLKEMRK